MEKIFYVPESKFYQRVAESACTLLQKSNLLLKQSESRTGWLNHLEAGLVKTTDEIIREVKLTPRKKYSLTKSK